LKTKTRGVFLARLHFEQISVDGYCLTKSQYSNQYSNLFCGKYLNTKSGN